MDIVEDFLSDPPMLHSWDGGKTWNSGGFQEHHLRALREWILRALPGNFSVVETGAGCSTILFMLSGATRVVSIAPDSALFGRIRSYCDGKGVPTQALEANVDYSEWMLPSLAEKNKRARVFDFALIDGGHGMPTVFVDLFFLTSMLRPEGYLMIDDVQLHSCKEAARLVSKQPGFELVLDLGKALVFRMSQVNCQWPDWVDQPYVAEMTRREGLMPYANSLRHDGASQVLMGILSCAPWLERSVRSFLRLIGR